MTSNSKDITLRELLIQHHAFEARYDFNGAAANELSFLKHEVLTILSKEFGQWWFAELNGKLGFVPRTYLTPVLPPEAVVFTGYSLTTLDNQIEMEECDCMRTIHANESVLIHAAITPVAAAQLSERMHTLAHMDAPDDDDPTTESLISKPHGYPQMYLCKACDRYYAYESYSKKCEECEGTGSQPDGHPCVCGPDHTERVELIAFVDLEYPRPTIMPSQGYQQAPRGSITVTETRNGVVNSQGKYVFRQDTPEVALHPLSPSTDTIPPGQLYGGGQGVPVDSSMTGTGPDSTQPPQPCCLVM